MGRVEAKVALVTGGGAAPGLGSAIAARLAEEGATVFVSDIDQASAEARAAEIRDGGGKASAIRHDVTSERDWDEVIGAIARAEGGIDIVINNAGIVSAETIDKLTPEDFTRVIDVNLKSVYLGTRRAVAEMRRGSRSGSIINISSVAALVAHAGLAAYSASKAGVLLFTKSVAMETAREKIRVNSVHPGMIWTTMQQASFQRSPGSLEAAAATIPMGELGEPRDIANCVLFLASEEARYITGAAFVVDGGMTMR
ncbi:SDR family NAD(P)-dependent oxidoreductase [Sphingomonas sp.]|uniref:SDR family NAD(P)-dependent oxidoreductase n=1 Tax=Sphingomonas sp. TaxID=28214 RepID=UPI003AFFA28E